MTHTAANVEILKGIDQAYQTVFGYDCDYDVAVAAELLHDLAKPYVFQWQADGSSLTGMFVRQPCGISERIGVGTPCACLSFRQLRCQLPLRGSLSL